MDFAFIGGTEVSKPLTEGVLRRLTTEALISFLGQSERFEAVLRPGCDLTLCNEPVADLNYVIAGRGASDSDHFKNACRTCLSRGLPFLAILFPEAGDGVKEVAAEVGLIHAVEFPFMVWEGVSIESSGNKAVEVQRATGAEGILGGVGVLSAAFNMPEDSTRRVLPPPLVESPGLDVFLASIEGRHVGTVTLTHHGDTTGIWAMGTDPDRQGHGIGRRLLSTAMAETRKRGASRFFLGATPAGFPLYEKLGFETRVVTSVWVSGETSQA